MMSEGYIYILFNRSLRKDFYKIGKTTRTPEQRAQELSDATGVPQDFEVLYEQRVIDCHRAERLIHERLKKYRTSPTREFFGVPLKVAIRVIEEVTEEVGKITESWEGNETQGVLSSGNIATEIDVVPRKRARQTYAEKLTKDIARMAGQAIGRGFVRAIFRSLK